MLKKFAFLLTATLLLSSIPARAIVWSIANETPVSEPRNGFFRSLAAKARSLDGSQMIGAAMRSMRSVRE